MYIQVYQIEKFLIITSGISLLVVTSDVLYNYKAYWYSYMYSATRVLSLADKNTDSTVIPNPA